MACSHLAAAASSPAAAALRSGATSTAAGVARLPATHRPEKGLLALSGRRAVKPVVVAAGSASVPSTVKKPIIVIDNYDSFTYNLCQCIGEAFGGKIIRVPSGVMHGKSSPVHYDEVLGKGIFEDLSNPFTAARYHSLVIEKESFPHDELEITAWTVDGLIMAARHKKHNHIQGGQFHPESIITPEGKRIILNFARYVEEFEKQTSEGN